MVGFQLTRFFCITAFFSLSNSSANWRNSLDKWWLVNWSLMRWQLWFSNWIEAIWEIKCAEFPDGKFDVFFYESHQLFVSFFETLSWLIFVVSVAVFSFSFVASFKSPLFYGRLHCVEYIFYYKFFFVLINKGVSYRISQMICNKSVMCVWLVYKRIACAVYIAHGKL